LGGYIKMTCYSCFKCGRYLNISKLGWIQISLRIKELPIKKMIPLCKWCIKKGKMNYKIKDGFTEVIELNNER